MDSTELQREALEEKGRDELTTIATALGGKPGSRARKAEIVDLILDLAGDNGAAVASSNGAPDRSDQPLAEWELAVAEDGVLRVEGLGDPVGATRRHDRLGGTHATLDALGLRHVRRAPHHGCCRHGDHGQHHQQQQAKEQENFPSIDETFPDVQ